MSDTSANRDGWLTRNKLSVAPWFFLAPALVFFAIYVVIPIFESIALSFYEWNGLYAPDGSSTAVWVGFQNYVKLWDDPNFWTSLKNNVAWLILYMLAVPAGLFIALFLNQTVTGMRFYKSMFFFPFVISQVVVGLIFGWFYNPDFGVVGSVWQAIFCEETTNILGNTTFKCSRPAPDILSSAEYATYGIIFAGLWPQIAYCMILYLTGLNNVAGDQIEAARLDGAKGWKMLWYVVLPQLRPAPSSPPFHCMTTTFDGLAEPCPTASRVRMPSSARSSSSSTSTLSPMLSMAASRSANVVVVSTFAGSLTRSRVKKVPSATASNGAAAADTASGSLHMTSIAPVRGSASVL